LEFLWNSEFPKTWDCTQTLTLHTGGTQLKLIQGCRYPIIGGATNSVKCAGGKKGELRAGEVGLQEGRRQKAEGRRQKAEGTSTEDDAGRRSYAVKKGTPR
jgi:hypothetical protein